MAYGDSFQGLLGFMQGQDQGFGLNMGLQQGTYPEPVQETPKISMGQLLKNNWGLLGTVAALSALANANGRRSAGQVIGNAGLDALSALGQVGMAKMKRDQMQQQNALARSQWEAADADRKLRNAISLGEYNLKLGKNQQELRNRAMLMQMISGAPFGDPDAGTAGPGGFGQSQPGMAPLPGSEDDMFEFGRPSGSGAGLGRLAQVPTQTGMGRVMAYHESGTQGSQHVSYGLPETDGVDVGKYSFITKGGSGGSAGAFIRWAGQQDSAVGRQLFSQFNALTGGNWAALDNPALWKSQGAAIWTALAKANPLEFEKLEDAFALGRINTVIRRDLDPGLQAAIKADKTGALYEMALSTINQHGNAATILNRQWKAHGGEGPESFIKAVYWDRGDPYWFRKTKDPGMGRRRMNQEVQDVLGILRSGGSQGLPALPGSPAGVQGNPLAPVQIPDSVPRTPGAQGNPLAPPSAQGVNMSGVPHIGDGRQAALRSPLLQGQQGQDDALRPRVPLAALGLGEEGWRFWSADQTRIQNERAQRNADRDFNYRVMQDNWNRENQMRQDARAEAKEKREQAKYELEMGEKAEKRQRSEAKAQTYAQGMLDDIAHIRELARDGILPAFGPAGIVGRKIPGTNAHAIDQTMESLRSRISLSALQEMRNNSQTGAAMGNVSDKDMALLENSITNLNLARSPEEVERSLQILEKTYLDVIHGEGNWQRDKDGNVFLLAGGRRRRGAGGPARTAQPRPAAQRPAQARSGRNLDDIWK